MSVKNVPKTFSEKAAEYAELIALLKAEWEAVRKVFVSYLMMPRTERDRRTTQKDFEEATFRMGQMLKHLGLAHVKLLGIEQDARRLEREYEMAATRLAVIEYQEKQLRNQLEDGKYDGLTGLLTREEFTKRFVETFMHEKRRSYEKNYSAFFYFDLRKFKQINDLLDHDRGDYALKRMGFFLKQIRLGSEQDLRGRWGGDEFLVLIHGLSGLEEIRNIVERLQQSIWQNDWGTELQMGNVVLRGIAADVGVIFWKEKLQPQRNPAFIKDEIFGTVRRHAERLMYRAKKRKRPEGGFECEEMILDGTFKIVPGPFFTSSEKKHMEI